MGSAISKPNPVSWQTLLWTLLPLLVNNWGQPSGRVLMMPLETAVFYRSFPPFALIDSIVMIAEILYTAISRSISPRLALD